MQYSIQTESAEQTDQLGRQLGRQLMAGSLVLLRGDLGAGKTCLATGIARGLGVAQATPVTSPTYTLMNSYEGRLPLYHFDLYRLSSEDELLDLGFDDYFHGDGVALVEWPERYPELSREALIVDLVYVGDEARQLTVTISGQPTKYQSVLYDLGEIAAICQLGDG
ncbi:MAG: tRNA (adenosine(37)-N6)-threonylcarbamoyltransferase complex ATPase subunit type 1 TsaE [Desulfobacteraceae bacterium 4572_35.2]|nr:MAG: tRNA (adenosine(37)-N6)-threonylcarbamoyltransferase complex ATPase subunit type 1 TsaE [Desulfobacteraceae bacterium 4572_35.2]